MEKATNYPFPLAYLTFHDDFGILGSMSNNTNIIKEITELTMLIRDKHPELYARLEEAPITLSPTAGEGAQQELQNYLSTLQEMLRRKEMAQKA